MDIKDPEESIKSDNKKPSTLDLRDVVKLFGDLTTASNSNTGLEKNQVDRIVTKNLQKALLAFKSQMEFQRIHNCRSKHSYVQKGRKRKIDERDLQDGYTPKKSKECFDCGSKQHFRGHPVCEKPSYQTKKRRFEHRKRNSDTDKKNEPEIRGFRHA